MGFNSIYKDIDYKGYSIGFNYYGNNEYSIFYCGDDLIFTDLKSAKAFIDDLFNNHL